jgi:hypothetical protein
MPGDIQQVLFIILYPGDLSKSKHRVVYAFMAKYSNACYQSAISIGTKDIQVSIQRIAGLHRVLACTFTHALSAAALVCSGLAGGCTSPRSLRPVVLIPPTTFAQTHDNQRAEISVDQPADLKGTRQKLRLSLTQLAQVHSQTTNDRHWKDLGTAVYVRPKAEQKPRHLGEQMQGGMQSRFEHTLDAKPGSTGLDASRWGFFVSPSDASLLTESSRSPVVRAGLPPLGDHAYRPWDGDGGRAMTTLGTLGIQQEQWLFGRGIRVVPDDQVDGAMATRRFSIPAVEKIISQSQANSMPSMRVAAISTKVARHHELANVLRITVLDESGLEVPEEKEQKDEPHKPLQWAAVAIGSANVVRAGRIVPVRLVLADDLLPFSAAWPELWRRWYASELPFVVPVECPEPKELLTIPLAVIDQLGGEIMVRETTSSDSQVVWTIERTNVTEHDRSHTINSQF